MNCCSKGFWLTKIITVMLGIYILNHDNAWLTLNPSSQQPIHTFVCISFMADNFNSSRAIDHDNQHGTNPQTPIQGKIQNWPH